MSTRFSHGFGHEALTVRAEPQCLLQPPWYDDPSLLQARMGWLLPRRPSVAVWGPARGGAGFSSRSDGLSSCCVLALYTNSVLLIAMLLMWLVGAQAVHVLLFFTSANWELLSVLRNVIIFSDYLDYLEFT